MPPRDFRQRYGPWALVAGASAGLGAAFASHLARRGLNLALVARRSAELRVLADTLTTRHAIEVRTFELDLARSDAATILHDALADVHVGLLVHNAARSVVGPFLESPLESHLTEIDVNCRAPLSLAYLFGARMAARGRGGIILMSSLAGFQGGPFIANYAATKAYNVVLAEGLWAELSPHNVDVLACCAGAIATPGYNAAARTPTSRFAPAAMQPEDVAAEALEALGRGPTYEPGAANRAIVQLMRRLLPRTTSVRLMERNTRQLNRSAMS
jgi:uncharacterized protein